MASAALGGVGGKRYRTLIFTMLTLIGVIATIMTTIKVKFISDLVIDSKALIYYFGIVLFIILSLSVRKVRYDKYLILIIIIIFILAFALPYFFL
jgi:hypothetical protein